LQSSGSGGGGGGCGMVMVAVWCGGEKTVRVRESEFASFAKEDLVGEMTGE